MQKVLNQGLSIGLGADSVNAGTIYSIFEQMKLSVLLPRSVWGAEDWVLSSEAFSMATQGGAIALLLYGIIGSIEEGKKADLAILSPSISLAPNNDVVNELALCENGRSVESVFIDGNPVMLEKKLSESMRNRFSQNFPQWSPGSPERRPTFYKIRNAKTVRQIFLGA